MNEILNKSIVLELNRNWQAIHVRTPQEAFCMMATNVATALEIDGDDHPSSVAPPLGVDRNSMLERGSRESRSDWTLRRVDIRPDDAQIIGLSTIPNTTPGSPTCSRR